MIGLMDCNNFFVSCERLFRPDLMGKPVAVLSSNDGCIVARSQEVKDLGIPMGVPLFEIRDVVEKHRITLFSSNFPLYRDVSHRVMSALREEFDPVSVYSIDEAFFTVSEGVGDEELARVRSRIIGKTGIPISIGIAPTKTMAKLANRRAKRGSGVARLTGAESRSWYQEIPVGEVWGVGRQIGAVLAASGVATVADFLDRGLMWVRNTFGVHGERLYFELSGIAASGTDDTLSPHASIASTRSFPKAMSDHDTIMSAIGHHVAHVGEKLRKRELMARGLTVVCAPGRFTEYRVRQGGATVVLEVPTNDTMVILSHARALLGTFFDGRVPYQKAGIIVSGLIPERYVSVSLFDDLGVRDAHRELHDVVDCINERYGSGTVRPAVSTKRSWAPCAALRSPSYTTRWREIPTVKAK